MHSAAHPLGGSLRPVVPAVTHRAVKASHHTVSLALSSGAPHVPKDAFSAGPHAKPRCDFCLPCGGASVPTTASSWPTANNTSIMMR